jgi:phage shock protein E
MISNFFRFHGSIALAVFCLSIQMSRVAVAADTRIIDVRTSEEFAESHVVGAKNIDVLGKDFDAKIDQLEKGDEYIVYCRSGSRADKAIKIMNSKGIKHTVNTKTAKQTADKLNLKCEGRSASC